MNLMDNPLILFAAIFVGIVAQQVLAWLKKNGKKTAYTIARPIVLIFWVVLGIAMVAGSLMQIGQGNLLPGISSLALGLGLMLTGLAQALELGWLRIIGVVVLATGPIIAGLDFILKDNALAGLIALALGIGILISALRGWPGGIGQMVVGAVLMGSAVMLLLGTLVIGAATPDGTTIAIGVIMLALSLWGLIGGALTLFGAVKPAKQTETSSA